jgi:hypothetical protein
MEMGLKACQEQFLYTILVHYRKIKVSQNPKIVLKVQITAHSGAGEKVSLVN